MRLTADENIPSILIAWLREQGHDVVAIAESRAGSPDRSILRASTEERRIVLTQDKDFGELVFRHGIRAAGIILIRFTASGADDFMAHWRARWNEVRAIAQGNFVLVEEQSIRVRALPPIPNEN